jgi:hypothetical protein
MTIVFWTGESAFLGNRDVRPGDVIEGAGPGNGFTVSYDLPSAVRPGLGTGSGDAFCRVTEDGVPNPDPLSFRFATTTADVVVVEYDLHYEGTTYYDRPTAVNLHARLFAVRTGPDSFTVDYEIDGWCDLGETFTDIITDFTAPGPPTVGTVDFGDGGGVIDDPDVYDLFHYDLDYFETRFRAEGDVGCCSYYEETFDYRELL